MAASHICLGCGQDLARVRAAIEPVYGLPVVACTGCGGVFVRRPDPIVAWWRAFKRAIVALQAMAVRMAAAGALLLASVALVYAVEVVATDAGVGALALPGMLLDPAGTHRGLPYDARPFGLMTVAMWLFTQAGVGILLSAGLRHWKRRWALWACWTGLVVLCLSVEPVVMWFWSSMDWLSGTEELSRPGLKQWAARLVYGVGTLAMAPIGIPLGRALESLGDYLRTLKFRTRRRRVRRDRGWTA